MMTAPVSRLHLAALALLTFICGALPLRADDWEQKIPAAPQIPQRSFKITDYGAKGDGTTLNTAAMHQAIAACATAGGGRVIVPAGKFVTGAFELASHMALVLEKDAVLQASDRFSDFGLPDPLPDSQQERSALSGALKVLIFGKNLTDVAIIGEGTIDGAGAVWWKNSDKASERAPLPPPQEGPEGKPIKPRRPLYVPRPNMIVLRNCERVLVQGVTLTNSPMFHFVPHVCREVLVQDVKIISPPDSPNTDGIDPANSRNVLIRRCFVDTGDDHIALKAGGAGNAPTENVIVTDCEFHHGHGVSIGSETTAGVRNFLVQHCRFEDSDNALRIKSDRTRGGVIEHVIYRDIAMKNVGLPITIFLYYDDKKAAKSPQVMTITDTTPKVRDILFSNITCDGALYHAGELIGLPESPLGNVRLDKVHIIRAAAPLTILDVTGISMNAMEIGVATGD